MKIAQCVEGFVARKRVCGYEYDSSARILRRFAAFVGKIDIALVSEEHINLFLTRGKLANPIWRSYRSLIRRFLANFAERNFVPALQGVIGAQVSVGEKDREFVPVGVKSELSKESEQTSEAKSGTTESANGSVHISSDLSGTNDSLDGSFVGNSPAAPKLTSGKHIITVNMSGYTDWTREISSVWL